MVVFQPLRFKSREELKRYVILRQRVFRVYPYAKLAAERLTVLNERLENIESKRGRKMQRLEKFIYEEFEEELKKLSKSQGRILIRLVHRQTGSTTRFGKTTHWLEGICVSNHCFPLSIIPKRSIQP